MCGIDCTKRLLLVFTCFLTLTGAGLIGIGTWTKFSESVVLGTFLGNADFHASLHVFIGVGVAVLLIGFLGCCGVVRGSTCVLKMFFAVLMITFLVELIPTILLFLQSVKVDQIIKDNVKDFVFTKYNTGDEALDNSVDILQEQLKCCGVHNYTDWRNSFWYKSGTKNNQVPQSCCNAGKNCMLSPNKNNTFTKGCQQALLDFVHKYMTHMGAIGSTISGINFLGMVFTCCFIRKIH